MKRIVIAVLLTVMTCAALLAQRGAAPAAPSQRQIAVLDRQGKVLHMVGDPGPAGVLVISPNGKLAAMVRGGSIFVFDIATNATTKVTSGPSDTQPAWSPDGSRIAFQSNRNGSTGLYQTLANGSGKEELLYAPLTGINLTGWSPDGRFLNFQGTDPATGTGTDLYVLPMNGDHKPIAILRTKANELGARISPDSRFFAYRSDESGRNEVYVRPFDPAANPEPTADSPKWKISSEGSGGMVRWREDGKELYFLSSSGGIMAVPVTTAPTFQTQGAPAALFQTPLDFPLTGTPGNAADVSADGKTFLLLMPVSATASAR